jgi:dTDP-4-amino-4,6-dideoxygalactose transaminase
LSCYSFYPSKNLGAYGDGGMITTENLKFYKKLLTLRNLGTIKKNCHQHEGINSRLDTLQASILLQKLKYTPINNNYRRKICAYYDKRLPDINKIQLTITDPGSSRHLYVIRVKNRNRLAKYLKKKNIATQFHYPYSLNRVGALKKKIKNVRLPISENWANECISLPLYPGLGISRAKYIIKQIKNFFRYK